MHNFENIIGIVHILADFTTLTNIIQVVCFQILLLHLLFWTLLY